MPYFAKLDEAFTGHRESKRYRGSNSSSSSLRMKRSPTCIDNGCGEEFNENYRIAQEPVICQENDSDGSDYCLNLINQVLQNNWCKKVLRNILLEEYMDRFLQHKIEAVANYQPRVQNDTQNKTSSSDEDNEQSGGNVDFLPSGKFWGLDLRTLSIIGLVILGGLYFYDFFQRLFR